MPERHKTAKNGRWRRGPGADLFRAAEEALGPLPLVAEDLGVITPRVEELRNQLGIPGMVVMQFAYAGPRSNPHRLENHRRHSVVYVATHDCDTALGWWSTLSARARRATGLPGVEPNWELTEAAFSSRPSSRSFRRRTCSASAARRGRTCPARARETGSGGYGRGS